MKNPLYDFLLNDKSTPAKGQGKPHLRRFFTPIFLKV